MIQLDNVTKQYANGQYGLRNLSLSIPGNHLVFIAGPTGAGKTTLANLLALRLRPTDGNIQVNGNELAALRGRKINRYRRSVGLILRDMPLLNNQSVGDNVALPLIINNAPPSKILPRVSYVLDTVGLRNRFRFSPDELSDAERQRVKIARAIVTRPQLIIADEPTFNMDSQMSDKIIQIFKRLVSENTTVIVTTHDQSLLADSRHPVIAIRKGQIYQIMQGSS